MSKKGYKDLEIYQEAYLFSLEIHKITLTFPKFEMYELGSEMRRASKSITLNIAEGYGRGKYQKEFIQFLIRASASCDEIKVQLDYCRDLEYLTEEKYKELNEKYEFLGCKIYRYIKYLEKNL